MCNFHSVHAQTIDWVSDMNFGLLDFGQTYNARIQLGTNGNLSVVGTGIAAGGGETAGRVRITLPDTGIVDIKCSSQAQLYDATATTLTVENIQISVGSGTGFGTGLLCGGTGMGDPVVTSIDMSAIPDPEVFIGGEIVINAPITLPNDHVYNTSGGGVPVTISVVVQ